jgi:hypothetical protein
MTTAHSTSPALQPVPEDLAPRDWYVRHLPGTNDLTYEVRVHIDLQEVRVLIAVSDAGLNEGFVDVSAAGARELAAHLLEAADLVSHIPSRDRVAETC